MGTKKKKPATLKAWYAERKKQPPKGPPATLKVARVRLRNGVDKDGKHWGSVPVWRVTSNDPSFDFDRVVQSLTKKGALEQVTNDAVAMYMRAMRAAEDSARASVEPRAMWVFRHERGRVAKLETKKSAHAEAQQMADERGHAVDFWAEEEPFKVFEVKPKG